MLVVVTTLSMVVLVTISFAVMMMPWQNSGMVMTKYLVKVVPI